MAYMIADIVDVVIAYCCSVLLMMNSVQESKGQSLDKLNINMTHIALLLLLMCVACAAVYYKGKLVSAYFVLVYMMAGIWMMTDGSSDKCVIAYGMPVLVYTIVSIIYKKSDSWKSGNYRAADIVVAIDALMIIGIMLYFCRNSNALEIAFLFLVVIIETVANVYNHILFKISHELIKLKDDSKELNMSLRARNQYLIEKQDSQLKMATLTERNRIAREIHDNVGHMLSRSILQVGALKSVNKNENMAPLIDGVRDTLDTAMSSIRKSVHDLHDESIDLNQSIRDIIGKMSGYEVQYEYDFSSDIPRNLKYCIISVVGEATANIIKHSNATKVNIILREHPAFYQILIQDNGRCINPGDGTGIGMENMRERVNTCGGNMTVNREDGYRIFIIIPKKEDSDESSCN